MPNIAPDDSAQSLQRSLLSHLTILNPCDVAWEGMSGSNRERHCESCAKSVHNLIEHTADEAYRLITEADAKVCVRIHRDCDGNVVTRDTLPLFRPTRRTFLNRWVAFAASCLGPSSLIGCKRVVNMLTPVTLQGDVCPPGSTGATLTGTGNGSVVMGGLRPPPKPTSTPLPPLPDALPASSRGLTAPTSKAPHSTKPKSSPTK